MNDGSSIIIEERPQVEGKTARGLIVSPSGKTGEHATVLITPEETNVWNPAFDVTPGLLVDAVVTEVGVAKPSGDLGKHFDLRRFVAQHGSSTLH